VNAIGRTFGRAAFGDGAFWVSGMQFDNGEDLACFQQDETDTPGG